MAKREWRNPGPKDILAAEPAALPGRPAMWQVQIFESSVGEWYGWAHGPSIFATKGEATRAARQVSLQYFWKTRVQNVVDPDPEVKVEQCYFCKKPMPLDEDQKIDDGWFPSAWHPDFVGKAAEVGPICAACLGEHCVQDGNDGWSVKPAPAA